MVVGVGVGDAVGIAAPVTSMFTLTVLLDDGRSASVMTARRKVVELGDGVLNTLVPEVIAAVRSFEVRTLAPAGTTSRRSS